jgi:hypothetical protein
MNDDPRITVLSAQATPPRAAGGPAGATAFVVGPGSAAPAGAPAEWLLPSAPGHAAACLCCTPRAALAEALHRLFLRRARGEVPFFRRVVAAASETEIAAALADPLVASRFRPAAASSPTVTPRPGFRCD